MKKRAGFVVSVALTVAVHAAVFVIDPAPAPRWRTQRATVMHLQVASAVRGVPTSQASVVPVVPAQAATATMPAAPPDRSEASRPPQSTAVPSNASPPPDWGPEGYVPRPLLSIAPVAINPVIIDFPASVQEQGRFVTVLSLFIGEEGFVDRVRVDGPAIPAALENAARRAFAQARFSPGQVDGVTVRSLVHIEVVFDNRPVGEELADGGHER